MQGRNILSTQRKQNKSKSKNINQSSLGRKNLIQTSKGHNQNVIPTLIPKNDALLKRSVSPKNSNQRKLNKKKDRNESIEKNKEKNELITKKAQNKQTQKQTQNMLKISNIEIQFPIQEDINNNELNLLCTSNYPKKGTNQFLRETHLKNDLSKSTYTKQIQSKNPDKKSLTKTRTQNSKNNLQSHNDYKKDFSQDKKSIRKTQEKVSLQKSIRKLENTVQPLKEKERQISKTKKTTLSKTKIGSKQRSQSTQTKGKSLNKNKLPPTIKSYKIPLAKFIPKPNNQKTKQRSVSQKKTLNTIQTKDQDIESQATKSPSFEELQKLRQQNQKYKMFLASSAFKIQELRKQIQQHKHIRENQRNIYNFQLNSLRKQLDCNKKQIGHLFSYDDLQTGNEIIPDQIIIETDNESSSVHESLHIVNQKIKTFGLDQNSEDSSHKLRNMNQSNQKNFKSNPSSFNQNEQMIQGSKIQDLIQSLKNDITKQDAANLKFLSQIQKIPSLEVQLSFQQGEIKASKNEKQSQQSQFVSEIEKKRFLKNKNTYSFDLEDSSSGLLLLSSIGK